MRFSKSLVSHALTETPSGFPRLGLLAGLCLAIALLVPVTPVSADKPSRVSDDPSLAAQQASDQISPLGQKIVALLNEERLSSLTIDPLLQKAAQGHADDMAARGFFSHINPEGQAPRERVIAVDDSFRKVVAENIARATFNASRTEDQKAEKFAEIWMNSPNHRRNILYSDFARTGLGIAKAGNEIFAVQVFSD